MLFREPEDLSVSTTGRPTRARVGAPPRDNESDWSINHSQPYSPSQGVIFGDSSSLPWFSRWLSFWI